MGSLPYRGVEDLNPEQVGKVRRDAALSLSRRVMAAAVSYLIALAVMRFTTPYAVQHPFVFYGFAVVNLSGIALRLVVLARFDRIYDTGLRRWYLLTAAGVLLTAVGWGFMAGFAVHYYGGNWTSLMASLITAAMCAGSMSSLSQEPFLFRSYVVLMLLPSIIAGIVLGGSAGVGLTIVYFTYLAYSLVQGHQMQRDSWEARINAVRLDADTRERLHRLTYLDPLTGLPNRVLLSDRLQQALHEARRERHQVGVMVLGLDRFKGINDTLGREAGDAVLREMALRLKSAMREGDTISRLSGVMFAVVLPSPSHAKDMARAAQKLLDHLARPVEIAGIELVATFSIGISLYPNDGDGPDTLLASAEAAMHRSKENGGNNFCYYEADMNAQTVERLQLETQLRRALARDEFQLHYQPKADLISGRLAGFEALLRWCPAGGSSISPEVFIPLLEETRLIMPVGEWTLRAACMQNRAWQEAGYPPSRIAVNLSARQFRENNLLETVERVLAETGLSPEWLEIEITESTLMEHSGHVSATLHALNEMGVSLAIDDFGTGYSSLAYLKRMPIHTLKIDRSFVADVTHSINDAAVVQAVIAMAHSLKLKVVAEGVETDAQLRFLRDHGCDEMQGYYYSRPAPAAGLESILEQGRCQHVPLMDAADAASRSDNGLGADRVLPA